MCTCVRVCNYCINRTFGKVRILAKTKNFCVRVLNTYFRFHKVIRLAFNIFFELSTSSFNEITVFHILISPGSRQRNEIMTGQSELSRKCDFSIFKIKSNNMA